jgi:hypothetical protein
MSQFTCILVATEKDVKIRRLRRQLADLSVETKPKVACHRALDGERSGVTFLVDVLLTQLTVMAMAAPR